MTHLRVLVPLACVLGVWLLAGIIYLAVLTRGFRVPPKKLEFEAS